MNQLRPRALMAQLHPQTGQIMHLILTFDLLDSQGGIISQMQRVCDISTADQLTTIQSLADQMGAAIALDLGAQTVPSITSVDPPSVSKGVQ